MSGKSELEVQINKYKLNFWILWAVLCGCYMAGIDLEGNENEVLMRDIFFSNVFNLREML